MDIENFYAPLSRKEARDLFIKLHTQNSLKEAEGVLLKNIKYIRKLQKRYKTLVLMRNKLVNMNYWEYIALWDGVPKKDLANIDSMSMKTIKKILTYLPNNYKKAYWFNSIFNNLNYQTYEDSVKLPDNVIDSLIDHRLCNKKDLEKIVFKKTDNWIASTDFDEESKKTIINYDPRHANYSSAVAIAHEIGHALQKEKDLNTYAHEKKAIEFELTYTKTLPKKIQNKVYADKLLTYATFFFEKEIYANPSQDFAKIYAKSIQKIHPEIEIKSNPLYVFNFHLIDYPCYSTVYVAIYNQLS